MKNYITIREVHLLRPWHGYDSVRLLRHRRAAQVALACCRGGLVAQYVFYKNIEHFNAEFTKTKAGELCIA